MLKQVSHLLALAGLALTLASAQPPMGGPPGGGDPVQRKVDMLTNMLSLTTAQAAQATTIYTNAQSASASLRTSQRTARDSMAAAIKTNNSASIDQIAANIGTLSGQIAAIDAKADAALYLTLTADQQAKWTQFGGGMGGPGMMGGRGGPRPAIHNPEN